MMRTLGVLGTVAGVTVTMLIAVPARSAPPTEPTVTPGPDAVTLTMAQADAELTDVIARTRARERAVGSRVDARSRGHYFTRYRATSVTTFDAATRAVKVSDATNARWLDYKGGSGVEALFWQHCRPERVEVGARSPGVRIRTAEGHVYDDLRVGSSPTQRRALARVGRPAARWDRLDRADDDYPSRARPPAAETLESLLEDWIGEYPAYEARRSTVTREARGEATRYLLLHRERRTFTQVVVDVNADRTVAAWSGEGRSGRTKKDWGRWSAAVEYARQQVVVPASRVVDRTRLQRSCDLVRLRDVLNRALPREVRLLNDRAAPGSPVTVAQVRRRIAYGVGDSGLLRLRYEDVAGGVRVTGRTALRERPLVRRVLVVDGRAVVRRGRT